MPRLVNALVLVFDCAGGMTLAALTRCTVVESRDGSTSVAWARQTRKRRPWAETSSRTSSIAVIGSRSTITTTIAVPNATAVGVDEKRQERG